MRYLVVIGKEKNYGALSPDVPGCFTIGDTREEVERNMQEALKAHIEWMLEEGDPLPIPHASPDDPEFAHDPNLTFVYLDIPIDQINTDQALI